MDIMCCNNTPENLEIIRLGILLQAAQLWREKAEKLLSNATKLASDKWMADVAAFLTPTPGSVPQRRSDVHEDIEKYYQDEGGTPWSEGGGGVIPPPSEVESVNKMPWDDMVWDFSLYTKAGVRVRRFVLVEKEDSKPEAGEFVVVRREDLEAINMEFWNYCTNPIAKAAWKRLKSTLKGE